MEVYVRICGVGAILLDSFGFWNLCVGDGWILDMDMVDVVMKVIYDVMRRQ